MTEEWKNLNSTHQVSNFGRFRYKTKKGYRYLKPFKDHGIYIVKINYKTYNCARLVAQAFIRRLKDNEVVFHKNNITWDNYYRNLEIITRQQSGKRTGNMSNARRVVEVENGEIVRTWVSARQAGKKLFISYQTVADYCNGKIKKPMYNLKWEDDFFDKIYKVMRG